ncbi:MAG: ABC transporter ATP-binding protein [Bacteroidota bacterium]
MIRINQLSFRYNRKANLFKSLQLELQPGNIYGLLGRNGAGKTTLLKIISGLHFPQEGELSVFGYQPKDRHPDFLGDLCFLPEELYVPKISVRQFVDTHAPFYPRFDRDAFDNYLQEFDISPSSRFDELSYGQKKKINLGFGLSTNARLLLLDEPTNGLDIPSKTQFRQLIARATTDDRIIVISTHQVRDMATLIDPIIILDQGSIIFQQRLEDVSQKLYFELIPSMQAPEDALYAERVPGGFLAVRPNENGWDSEVDIEVLFNAIVQNKDRVDEFLGQSVR